MNAIFFHLQTLVQLNPLMLTMDPKTLRSVETRLQRLCMQDMMEIKLVWLLCIWWLGRTFLSILSPIMQNPWRSWAAVAMEGCSCCLSSWTFVASSLQRLPILAGSSPPSGSVSTDSLLSAAAYTSELSWYKCEEWDRIVKSPSAVDEMMSASSDPERSSSSSSICGSTAAPIATQQKSDIHQGSFRCTKDG